MNFTLDNWILFPDELEPLFAGQETYFWVPEDVYCIIGVPTHWEEEDYESPLFVGSYGPPDSVSIGYVECPHVTAEEPAEWAFGPENELTHLGMNAVGTENERETVKAAVVELHIDGFAVLNTRT